MTQPIIVSAPTPLAEAATSKLKRALKTSQQLPETVFAVGGDGTMLAAIRKHWRRNPLFVGISAGHLGFLQSFDPDEIAAVILALGKPKPDVISAPLMVAKQADGTPIGHAFNDISAERASARASRVHVVIDGSTGTFIGDGLIFATAFGSTAYSLAAGGPIIDTRADNVFVVTPNNPHVSTQYSSLQRPHVLARGRQVVLHVTAEDADERPTQLVVDGETLVAKIQDDITIGLSDETVRFLQLAPDSFHARLEAKRLGRS